MSDAAFIVALDGPSDTGKSTLAEGLRSSLGLEVLVIPCYADLAEQELPPARGEDADEQLQGLKFYLDIDRERREIAAAAEANSIVIADRSRIGLLAHTYAIEYTGGPAAYQAARALMEERVQELLTPDLVFYLALDAAGRTARRAAGDRDAWHASEGLNEQMDHFFTNEAPGLLPGAIVSLDASPAAQDVRRSAEQTIFQRRGRP